MLKRKAKKRSAKEVQTMKQLIKGNTPTGLIAYKLGRTKLSIYSKSRKLKLSLKPVNKSPYTKQKK